MIRGAIGTGILGCLFGLVAYAGTVEKLAENFASPPDSARAWVYWFWLNGNVSKEGITADLEAMKRAGLGGALLMWGGGLGAVTDQPVKFLSPQWWELMHHAIREADRLGLELNITSGSGWTHSGGPWVKKKDSMRNLQLARAIRWDGPGKLETVINAGNPITIPVVRMAEGGDPAPNVIKTLTIDYTVDNQHKSVSAKDGETVRLFSEQRGKIRIDRAIYGVADDPARWWEVRELAQEVIDDCQLACVVAYRLDGAVQESIKAVNLTDKIDSAGRLSWEAPQGAGVLGEARQGGSQRQGRDQGDIVVS